MNQSAVEKELFKIRLSAAVQEKCCMAINEKGKVDYIVAGSICNDIRRVFLENLGLVPSEIESVCQESREIVSESRIFWERTRKAFMRAMALVIGGWMALFGTCLLMGWGAGLWGSLKILFIGHPVLAPLCWIAGGVFLFMLTSFFFRQTSAAVYTEKFEQSLGEGLARAIEAIWPVYGSELERIVKKPSVPIPAEAAKDRRCAGFLGRIFEAFGRRKEVCHE